MRGFAEVLRNELKPHNINVALVYPPDTQTPGFDRENQTKPAECIEVCIKASLVLFSPFFQISAGGKLASADEVAASVSFITILPFHL